MALWTPADITTALWLDADDSGTITLDGSSNVERWDDKSGNARHATQGTSTNRPGYDSTDKYLSFDGENDNLLVNSHLGIFNSDPVVSVYFVGQKLVQSADTNQWMCPFISGDAASGDFYVPLRENNNDKPKMQYRAYDGTTNRTGDVGVNWPESSDLIAGWVDDGVTGQAFLNGSTAGDALTTDLSGYSALTCKVGGPGHSTNDNGWWRGRVSEIIICPYAIDTTTRQKIEGYLAHKWGLEGSLPTDHPYKSSPPYVFTCSGYTSVNGTRASGIPVRLYRRDTGALIGETTSAGVSGTFSIESDYNDYHYAVAIHPTSSGTNALIYDYLKPGE